jgi:hypothetical protein
MRVDWKTDVERGIVSVFFLLVIWKGLVSLSA